ncbi:ornithine decarboxylase, partial [Kipferlia bialata]
SLTERDSSYAHNKDENWVYGPSDYKTPFDFVNDVIESHGETESFMAVNLTAVKNQVAQWRRELPMVDPYYAVKCNPNPAIIKTLAALGVGFDCATMGEISTIIDMRQGHKKVIVKTGHPHQPQTLDAPLDVAGWPEAYPKIVYAHPAKMVPHLMYARDNNVNLTVFDGEDELHKMAAIPDQQYQLLMRLTTDDASSLCQFSAKFGADVDQAPHLLSVAKELGLKVVGVSFHVGSNCGDPGAYQTSLDHAARVFRAAKDLGLPPLSIVDIGGGFPGDHSGKWGPLPTFSHIASTVRSAISHFCTSLDVTPAFVHTPTSGAAPEAEGRQVRFIAEPGRYMVSASTVVATQVYARKRLDVGTDQESQALYTDDGCYGSFNNVLLDEPYRPVPLRLKTLMGGKPNKAVATSIFGPTCDGIDVMCKAGETQFERCEVGDWLVFEHMGAYTHTASFVFNGYTHIPAHLHYVLE